MKNLIKSKIYPFIFTSYFKNFLCLTLAFLVVSFLFYVMSVLVSQDPHLSPGGESPSLVEFIQSRPKERVHAKKRSLPKKPEKEKKIPKMQLSPQKLSYQSGLKVNLPDLGDVLDGAAGGSAGAYGSLTPLVRIQPEYPIPARLQGIEGYVVLSFDISPTGSVLNPRVVDSRPQRIFDQVSLRAVRRWKYSPVIRDGKPVLKKNEKTLIEFTMDKTQ